MIIDWIYSSLHPQFLVTIGVTLYRTKCFARNMLTQMKQRKNKVKKAKTVERVKYDGPQISFLKASHYKIGLCRRDQNWWLPSTKFDPWQHIFIL